MIKYIDSDLQDIIRKNVNTEMKVDDLFSYIADNYSPEDVFGYKPLEKWAEDNKWEPQDQVDDIRHDLSLAEEAVRDQEYEIDQLKDEIANLKGDLGAERYAQNFR